ncbi:uncharacterized protein LOC118163180 [Oxyura jamaicensis]|uniref:uncharacterized protein LOC118163180 n=1 Tax=Oxyura jamaicensis TaxID=8884 RepID=UPI0015A512F2|nr:uncharacterized protein LOC118163180 [Oxyura jamaicensis]
MEKAEKLRSAQSLPFLCHSLRSIPEHGAVPLRKSVSVSELVARYQSILDCESRMSKKEHPKLMERRYLSQSNGNPMGKKHALSQSHCGDVSWSKSTEDLPIHKISATTRNLKGLLTTFDTRKVNPQSNTLPFAPLKTPSYNGILRKREADARILTTIQPLSRETKSHREPSFPSSLQSIQRKAQWSPATFTWKKSAAEEGKISRDRQVIISSVPDAASDSATGRSYERTRSFLDVSDSTRHILQQGRGKSSSLSVKELSARYLSQAAAAAAHGGPTQPRTVKDSSTPSSDRQKTSKLDGNLKSVD